MPSDTHPRGPPQGGGKGGREGGGESRVEADLGDTGQLAPGHHAQAAVHEQREQQAAPMGLPADTSTQGLLHWSLLQRESNEEEALRAMSA